MTENKNVFGILDTLSVTPFRLRYTQGFLKYRASRRSIKFLTLPPKS